MDIKKYTQGPPVPSDQIGWAEFVELTSAHATIIGELIELGWLAPVVTHGEQYLFTVRDVYRMRKHARLCRDFELPVLAGTIMVDLLERIEQLELQVEEMTRLLGK